MADSATGPMGSKTGAGLVRRYLSVRALTVALVEPLSAEDAQAQSMPDASPAKWHLAHTTWFFERFVLGRPAGGVEPLRPDWHRLFNSYYRSAGQFHYRPERGLLTRPSLAEVLTWRQGVDARMQALLAQQAGDPDVAMRTTLGLNHEQQHQELLLTDIRHLLSRNPLKPVYRANPPPTGAAAELAFVDGPAGEAEIGAPDSGFAYDNERPRHRLLLTPYQLGNRLLTNREYRAFIDDGGYRTPSLWLDAGWQCVERNGWDRPLYWSEGLDSAFTLAGERGIDPDAPVCNLSFYEAEACARWAGARLPREAEWEALAAQRGGAKNERALDLDCLAPRPPGASEQWFGDAWEWTASPYVGYPGFQPLAGSFGEYNGKFMSNQMVLRGGSCATPAGHIQPSYRNFFAPASRWQFTGLRLARDA